MTMLETLSSIDLDTAIAQATNRKFTAEEEFTIVKAFEENETVTVPFLIELIEAKHTIKRNRTTISNALERLTNKVDMTKLVKEREVERFTEKEDQLLVQAIFNGVKQGTPATVPSLTDLLKTQGFKRSTASVRAHVKSLFKRAKKEQAAVA